MGAEHMQAMIDKVASECVAVRLRMSESRDHQHLR